MCLCRNHDPVTHESYVRLGTIFILPHTHHSYHHTEEDMHQLIDERKDNQGPRTPLTFNIERCPKHRCLISFSRVMRLGGVFW